MQQRSSVEVCFSPGLFPDILTKGDFIVVVVDILRATTTICTAVANGVEAIVPVASHAEAKRLKSEGCLVATERDGVQLDWADFGNSAFSFTGDAIGGKTLVYCTTNGTGALKLAAGSEGVAGVAIGSFINLAALTAWLAERQKDVVILCAGWKNKVCLEDTLFAGALAARLLASGGFETVCDSVAAAIDLWNLAEGDPVAYIEKADACRRLQRLGLDDVIPYSFECDRVKVVPVFDGKLIKGYVAPLPTA